MPFRIRDARPSAANTDAKFIASAFDSCIPHLASIGSAAQWGTVPPSTSRPGFLDRYVAAVAEAEAYRVSGSGPLVRVLIAEALVPPPPGGEGTPDGEPGESVPGTGTGPVPVPVHVPVGAAVLRGNHFHPYLLSQEHLRAVTGKALAGEEGPFMFLDTLVTDFSEATRAHRKGAGAALVEYARGWAASELGMGVMYVDCWAGNEGKLVRFYETQGFQRIDGFVVEKPDGEKWPGMFLRMQLKKRDVV